MNLRKLRKAVSGLIAGLVMIFPCRRESDPLPEADLRQEICSRMGYRYTKEGWDIMKLEGVIEQLVIIQEALRFFNGNLPF